MSCLRHFERFNLSADGQHLLRTITNESMILHVSNSFVSQSPTPSPQPTHLMINYITLITIAIFITVIAILLFPNLNWAVVYII